MAVIFCDSGTGNDADDGSTWALAKATLQAAVTAAGTGGTVYLADTHLETLGANYTLTGPAAAVPVTVIVSDVLTGTSVSYVKAPAVQINASSAGYDIAFDGAFVFIGCYFYVGDDYLFNSSGGEIQRFIDCTLEASNGSVCGNAVDSVTEIINTEFKLRQTATLSTAPFNFLASEYAFYMSGCTFTAAAGALSNYTGGIFRGNDNCVIDVSGSDFSGFTGASELVTRDANTLNHVYFDACKMPSGVPVFSTAVYSDVKGSRATRCDGNNFGILHDSYWGQLVDDATIYRTGGASDGDAFAWKVVTSAACGIGTLYYTQWMPVWVDATGSKTFTVYIGNASADLTDTECWLEVEYLGTASSTLPSTATNRATDILAAGTAHTDDTTSSWTGGLTYMQSLAKTVTVNKAGLAQVRLAFIKASATVYIDPLVTVS